MFALLWEPQMKEISTYIGGPSANNNFIEINQKCVNAFAWAAQHKIHDSFILPYNLLQRKHLALHVIINAALWLGACVKVELLCWEQDCTKDLLQHLKDNFGLLNFGLVFIYIQQNNLTTRFI